MPSLSDSLGGKYRRTWVEYHNLEIPARRSVLGGDVFFYRRGKGWKEENEQGKASFSLNKG